jgi:hypothetical protein
MRAGYAAPAERRCCWGYELDVSSFRAVLGLLRRSRALGVGAAVFPVACLHMACPQTLADDFFTPPGDASPPPADASPGLDAEACAPFDACGGRCVDLASDALHCGACNQAIGEDQLCSQGNPVAASTGCGPRRLCARGCVDPNNSPFHCGACEVACKLGERCMMGRCQCPAGTRDCGDTCRQCCSDADCPMEKTCSAGVCELICSAPLVACMDRCADLQTEPKHCGRCGNDCGPMGTCMDGTCSRP